MARIRVNVDRLYAALQTGSEAVISTASGCGRIIADYGRLLAEDPHYAERAKAVSAAHRDIAAFWSGKIYPASALKMTTGYPFIALHAISRSKASAGGRRNFCTLGLPVAARCQCRYVLRLSRVLFLRTSANGKAPSRRYLARSRLCGKNYHRQYRLSITLTGGR